MNDGLILFNKPPGITSFDALRDIKRSLGTGKVGHAGTLDKFAQGLLLVLTGRALKLTPWFTHCDKQYIGRIYFGTETDTLDPEGNEIAQADIPSREETEKAIALFKGEIMQSPPVYSAIHINGKRASALARSGQMPEMKKRQVNIHKIEMINWEPPFADIFVHCSSGTYIRSLARDIALAAGSRGYLTSLVRTQIAGFKLPIANEQLEDRNEPLPNHQFIYSFLSSNFSFSYSLLPITKDVINSLGLSWFEIDCDEAQKLIFGKPLEPILFDKLLYSCDLPPINAGSANITQAAVFCGETLTAIVEKADGKWSYRCVLEASL